MSLTATISCGRNKGLIGCIVLTLLLGFCLSHPLASNAQAGQKSVDGKVIGSNDQPLSEAIVYLKNSKTGDIKSFISSSDGSYRFGQLSPDIDYEIWSEYHGRKSSVKTVSSFDSKKLTSYVLKVDIGK
jgi:Carboxypeptidase regulatory-like domain